MKSIFKSMFLCGAFCVALDASAVATVTRTLVRQQWPWHAKVYVDYRLDNAAGESVEVKVSVTNGTRAIALPSRALTGPRMGKLPSGDYRLTIDPAKLDFAGTDVLDDFKVSLSVAAAPADADTALYRIYDLIARTRMDVTKASLVNGDWGDVETTYDFAKGGSFNPSDVVVWTGVTNNPTYKTNCLVMRYVPAGSFTMLPTTNAVNVTLTKPYYIGVFEMTYAQCELIKAGRATMTFSNATCRAMRPMDTCSFQDIRGANSTQWPTNTAITGAATYIYNLRVLTGDSSFDLPTEARWEYAARAGTTSRWNNGANTTTSGLNNLACNRLGRTKYSGGWIGDGATTSSYVEPAFDVGTESGTAIVGSYLPNAWGLYDCHGNVAEWCLDRYVEPLSLTGGEDPLGGGGDVDGSYRTIRGRSWYAGTTSQYTDQRGKQKYNVSTYDGSTNGKHGTLGFRVICEVNAE